MRRNTHIIVPKEAFRLLPPRPHAPPDAADAAASAPAPPPPAEYRFGTMTAVHQFCSTCGVCAFYRPRSNPEGVAVTLWCVRPGTLRSVEVRRFGGCADGEGAYAETGIAGETPGEGGKVARERGG